VWAFREFSKQYILSEVQQTEALIILAQQKSLLQLDALYGQIK
jgi:hypothetical protein